MVEELQWMGEVEGTRLGRQMGVLSKRGVAG